MIQAMDWLQRHAKDSFKDFLADMRHKVPAQHQVRQRDSAPLTQGLFSGLYAHMDPCCGGLCSAHHADHRSLWRAAEQPVQHPAVTGGVHNLVYEYPTHDFVIDRSEAREVLFNNDQVRCPDSHENALGLVLAQLNPA
jgi:hypothetical protein